MPEFFNPIKLAAAFGRTHRLLFSRAINAVTTINERSMRNPSTAGAHTIEANLRSQWGAITLPPTFVLLSQILLAANFLSSLCLLYAYRKRPLALGNDPSNIYAYDGADFPIRGGDA